MGWSASGAQQGEGWGWEGGWGAGGWGGGRRTSRRAGRLATRPCGQAGARGQQHWAAGGRPQGGQVESGWRSWRRGRVWLPNGAAAAAAAPGAAQGTRQQAAVEESVPSLPLLASCLRAARHLRAPMKSAPRDCGCLTPIKTAAAAARMLHSAAQRSIARRRGGGGTKHAPHNKGPCSCWFWRAVQVHGPRLCARTDKLVRCEQPRRPRRRKAGRASLWYTYLKRRRSKRSLWASENRTMSVLWCLRWARGRMSPRRRRGLLSPSCSTVYTCSAR